MLLTNAIDHEEYDFMEKPIRLRSGINHIAFDTSGELMAFSDVYMHVTVQKDGLTALERDFNFMDDRIRAIQRIRGLQFSEDASILFVVAGDTLYAVDVETGNDVWTYTAPRSFAFLVISPCCVTVRGGFVAASFDNGYIGVWSEDGLLQSLWHHNDAPRQMAFTSDAQTLVGTDSFSITTWNWQTRKRTYRVRLRDRAYGFALAPNSTSVAVWNLACVDIYSLVTGEVSATLKVGPGFPSLAFAPDGSSLAVCEDDRTRIYSLSGVDQGACNAESQVLSVAFDPKGDSLAMGCSDGKVRVGCLPRA
jgi:WD40 repeat protein